MKKLSLIGLAIALPLAFSSNAMAMQCPPPSAFHHAAKGEPWLLDTAFTAQGWQDASHTASTDATKKANDSNLKSIPAKKWDKVLVNLYTDGYWRAQCSYDLGDGIHVSALSKQAFDAENVAQPPFKYQNGVFICTFTGENVTKCKFPESNKVVKSRIDTITEQGKS